MNSDSPHSATLEERLNRLERLVNTTIVFHVISLTFMLIILLFVIVPGSGTTLLNALSPSSISGMINESFGPILRPIFAPIDKFLAGLSHFPSLAKIFPSLVAIGYFIGTMIWVFVGLKPEFVNLNAPRQDLLHDLRFWTIISMLPHVIVYFYFTG